MPGDQIKCVVWDLDDTLWNGVLLENDALTLRPGVRELIEDLDRRGVLLSVASKNEPRRALAKLAEFGLQEYFLYPEISWKPKSEMLREIARRLGIGLDSLLFVDDSAFERAEVADAVPQVRRLDAADLDQLPGHPALPESVSAEARRRRQLYREAQSRQSYEESYAGPRVAFLRSLEMKLQLAPATSEDLLRAAELTQRTHQLNTTGLTFSVEELSALLTDPSQSLLVARLTDRFGDLGTIGLVLLGRQPGESRIRLFLMSCRVMGRNVGGAILTYLARSADARGEHLTADFLPTEVNRPMYLVYRLAGFQETTEGAGPVRRLRLAPDTGRNYPDYLQLDLGRLA
ncbi:HAD-IIIC family phosphatase [Kitasatospora sp. GAS204B]|uniref:HAD-IIIC family phosphatase n=1 Tax=unclassified Kitasatospora TaxID=2633591 RepID=UPI0024752F20|nr:HAD-IIIC family phosphatase [Kitasatospora sp. GAS204B]MDH6118608.1 FkbH-like protein [Kitasatospora sp. GAS204B]